MVRDGQPVVIPKDARKHITKTGNLNTLESAIRQDLEEAGYNDS